ncbi:MAG TPA: YkvA family protein [Actinomycetales bacterium]|nr:YkvA family protein [Actinomycetales bacterium]
MAQRLGRVAALKALWMAITGQRRPGAPGVGRLLAAFPRMALATLTGRYPGLQPSRLGLMLLAALYIISPIDLIPEAALLFVGLVDDAFVLAWLAGALLSETEAFLDWEAAGRPTGSEEGRRVVPGEVI